MGRGLMRGLAQKCRSFASLDLLVRRWAVAGVLDFDQWGVRFKYSSAGDDVLADLLFYEPDRWAQMAVFVALARRCEVTLDVGANTGLNAIVAALANPASTVYAFEPHPNNLARLRRNVELNGLSNVRSFQQAVGAEVGELELTIPTDGSITMVASAVSDFAEGFLGENCRRIRVPTVTVDSFVREHEIQKVDLLKIDVEYYEREVLAGATATIEAHAPLVWCEVLPYEFAVHTMPNFSTALDPDHSDQIEAFMRERGYSFYSVHDRGLIRVDTLTYSPAQDNFLFSRKRSQRRFLPYSQMDALLDEVAG